MCGWGSFGAACGGSGLLDVSGGWGDAVDTIMANRLPLGLAIRVKVWSPAMYCRRLQVSGERPPTGGCGGCSPSHHVGDPAERIPGRCGSAGRFARCKHKSLFAI